jgi:hypothetical protein
MTTIDRALEKAVFRVVPTACFIAAQSLRHYHRPVERHPWSTLPPAQQLAFKLAFISICHEFNWDFLQQRLAEVLLDDPFHLAERLATVDARQVREWLINYPRQERVHAQQRASLLRDVGRVLLARWRGDAANLIIECGGRLVGAGGFFEELDEFAAYRADPQRKKSKVLVHDLIRESILRFVDESEVEPAVDYHLIRIYVRTGRVVSRDAALDPFFEGRPRPRKRLMRLLREAVSDAAKLTALYANIPVPDINYVEWQFARTICRAEGPACEEAPRDQLPHDVAALVETACPYHSFCEKHNRQRNSVLREPEFSKGYY